jgi:hypothetical protein
MKAPDGLYRLVDRFDQNRDAYRSGRYNETQARVEFIDPLFELLGWDINNRNGAPEAYKDIVHEDAIKVGGAHKAPDYGFRVGGVRKFFVEAKKPSVNLRDDVGPAFQLRRYAWSAKLPVSILTDFEEFAVYDTRVTPDKKDAAATARLQIHSFEQYPDAWEEIAGVFSKEAVLGGSLDAYAEKAKGKRGTATVDAVFLKEIESWRETLARDLALRNPDLSQRELNYAVQITIDRIIFLRMTEDRGIEDYGRLQALLNGQHVYGRLRDLYRQADERYNSGLFHFQQEKGRGESHDTLTPKLTFGDTSLKGIIKSLYYPDSPYEFSVLPIEVLGQVYEQFLGKVIELSPNRAVKIEEKPEVRKAGGVYYTPKYIVDYIVEHTVGKLVEGKRPGARGGVSKLRIVDPACGSGSFLIGAYEYLLDWHRDRYIEDGPEKHRNELYQGPGGEWRLTTTEKKRILLNNIYGVDIDPQAVEVTKLSLLLKVLEGESSESLVSQLSMFRERALPDLSNNIKCGNSLVGPDFYDTQQLSLLVEEDYYRINVFDWKEAFPDILLEDQSGFDAVIGNPPYVRMEAFVGLKRYFSANYAVHDERTDLYAYFIEMGLRLLTHNGLFSMIVSNKFVKAKYGTPLRNHVTEVATPIGIVDFAGLPVFENATVRTLVMTLRKDMGTGEFLAYSPPSNMGTFSRVRGGTLSVAQMVGLGDYEVDWSRWKNNEWSFAPIKVQSVLEKLLDSSERLSEWLDVPICYGVKSGLVDAFVLDTACAEALKSRSCSKCADVIRPYVVGREVLRYAPVNTGSNLIYTYHGIDLSSCDAIQNHLEQYRSRLEARATQQEWFELQQPQQRYVELMAHPKIIYPDIARKCRFTIDEEGHICGDTSFAIPLADNRLLSLLNSRLAYFYFREVCAALEGASDKYLRFKLQYVANFPIPRSIADNSGNDLKHLAKLMLVLHRQAASAKTDYDRNVIQHQINATDRRIDQLVYEMYGLTDEEIAVVEESVS